MTAMNTDDAPSNGTPERVGNIISEVIVALIVAFFAYGYLRSFFG